MEVVGRADTMPLEMPGQDSDNNRNRRVEIAINQGKPKFSDPISVEESR